MHDLLIDPYSDVIISDICCYSNLKPGIKWICRGRIIGVNTDRAVGIDRHDGISEFVCAKNRNCVICAENEMNSETMYFLSFMSNMIENRFKLLPPPLEGKFINIRNEFLLF